MHIFCFSFQNQTVLMKTGKTQNSRQIIPTKKKKTNTSSKPTPNTDIYKLKEKINKPVDYINQEKKKVIQKQIIRQTKIRVMIMYLGKMTWRTKVSSFDQFLYSKCSMLIGVLLYVCISTPFSFLYYHYFNF